MFEQTNSPSAPFSLDTVCLTLLLAFVLGQLIAWIYVWSHSGLSYSRSFTQSLILVTLIVSLVMLVIGNNIVTAFGLLGALAIIRFRNVLKDTRDTVFIFAGLVTGMAVGSQRHDVAIIGVAAFALVTLYLKFTGFGVLRSYDGFLQCRVPAGVPNEHDLQRILRRFCRGVRRISMRQAAGESTADLTYQVRLRDKRRGNDLVSELERLQDVSQVSLVIQEEISEV